jgi:dinuclear metal center YbgI/SA1388 family protein
MSEKRIRDVTAALDSIAPQTYAMDGDVIGLQIGILDKPVKRVMLALDPSPQSIDAAIAAKAELLLTHHALLYRPLRQIDTSTARGQAIARALAHDLTIYNAHTNLDIVDGGVNDVLAERMGLHSVEILDRIHSEQLRKLVVFVPESHHQAVFTAVCEAGAGHIGGYSHCTFNTPGEGTFKPGEGTNPFIGKVDTLERTREVRLETIVPASLIEPVVRRMFEAHPYEEVAYDLYPLELMGKAVGIGRIGTLDEAIPLGEFANRVRVALDLPHIRFSGDPHRPVQRIALLGGSGGKWVQQAMAKGADVFVTADCDHHTVAEALQDGLAMIDATHAAMERPVLYRLQERLSELLGSVEFSVYTGNEDPFQWL